MFFLFLFRCKFFVAASVFQLFKQLASLGERFFVFGGARRFPGTEAKVAVVYPGGWVF
jgi:hypothetical protein